MAETGTPIAPEAIRTAAADRRSRTIRRRALIVTAVAAIAAVLVYAAIVSLATAGQGIGSSSVVAPTVSEPRGAPRQTRPQTDGLKERAAPPPARTAQAARTRRRRPPTRAPLPAALRQADLAQADRLQAARPEAARPEAPTRRATGQVARPRQAGRPRIRRAARRRAPPAPQAAPVTPARQARVGPAPPEAARRSRSPPAPRAAQPRRHGPTAASTARPPAATGKDPHGPSPPLDSIPPPASARHRRLAGRRLPRARRAAVRLHRRHLQGSQPHPHPSRRLRVPRCGRAHAPARPPLGAALRSHGRLPPHHEGRGLGAQGRPSRRCRRRALLPCARGPPQLGTPLHRACRHDTRAARHWHDDAGWLLPRPEARLACGHRPRACLPGRDRPVLHARPQADRRDAGRPLRPGHRRSRQRRAHIQAHARDAPLPCPPCARPCLPGACRPAQGPSRVIARRTRDPCLEPGPRACPRCCPQTRAQPRLRRGPCALPSRRGRRRLRLGWAAGHRLLVHRRDLPEVRLAQLVHDDSP